MHTPTCFGKNSMQHYCAGCCHLPNSLQGPGDADQVETPDKDKNFSGSHEKNGEERAECCLVASLEDNLALWVLLSMPYVTLDFQQVRPVLQWSAVRVPRDCSQLILVRYNFHFLFLLQLLLFCYPHQWIGRLATIVILHLLQG